MPKRSKREAHHHTKRLADHEHVDWVEQQISKTRVKRGIVDYTKVEFQDPEWVNQWYLVSITSLNSYFNKRNLLQLVLTIKKDTDKLDLHILQTWGMGYTGKGIVVSVLDDGK